MIRDTLGKSSGPIAQSELMRLTALDAYATRVNDIGDLQYCLNLQILDLGWNSISDITPLAGLTQLTSLYLDDNSIGENLDSLANLTSLTCLSIAATGTTDISVVANFSLLEEFYAGENPGLSNIEALTNLNQLTRVFMGGCAITDISPLAGHAQLVYLSLPYNSIADITPLVGLSGLEALDLRYNGMTLTGGKFRGASDV